MADTIGVSGEYNLEEVVLISASGTPTKNLAETVLEINLWESIDAPFITGKLIFNDEVNYHNILPIIGQEILKLTISTPSMFGPDIIELLLFVYKVDNVLHINQNNDALTLSFCSMEQIIAQRKIVTRTLVGTWSDILTNIVRKDLESKKNLYIEPCSGLQRIVPAGESPFNLIDDAKMQSISQKYGSPTYFFFETLNGIHFQSLESLYDTPMQGYYTSDTIASLEIGDKGRIDVQSQFSKMRKFTRSSSNDTAAGQVSGTYSSTIIEHDIFNKRYTTSGYNYFNSFDDEKHINEFHGQDTLPMYSRGSIDDNSGDVASYPAKEFLLPTSIKDINTGSDATKVISAYAPGGNEKNQYPFKSYSPSSWLTRRTSTIGQLTNGIEITFQVDGNTTIKCGDIVEVNLPRTAANKDAENEGVDKFIRGPFLIKSLVHQFNKRDSQHNTVLTCVKECVDKVLDGSTENPLPQTEYGTTKTNPITFNKPTDFYR